MSLFHFCVWCEPWGEVQFLSKWISNFLSTICWRIFLFFTFVLLLVPFLKNQLTTEMNDFILADWCAQLLSCVQLFAILWTVDCQALLSMKYPRQEYWSGLTYPSSEDILDLGIYLHLLHLLDWHANSLPLEPAGKVPHPKTNPTSSLLYESLTSKHLENTHSSHIL